VTTLPPPSRTSSSKAARLFFGHGAPAPFTSPSCSAFSPPESLRDICSFRHTPQAPLPGTGGPFFFFFPACLGLSGLLVCFDLFFNKTRRSLFFLAPPYLRCGLRFPVSKNVLILPDFLPCMSLKLRCFLPLRFLVRFVSSHRFLLLRLLRLFSAGRATIGILYPIYLVFFFFPASFSERKDFGHFSHTEI